VVEDRVLRGGAGDGGAEDLGAGGDPGDASADLVDGARGFQPGDGGQRDRYRPAGGAAADLPVHRVDPGRADPDPDLAGPRVRLVDIGESQHLGRPEAVEAHCLHGDPSAGCDSHHSGAEPPLRYAQDNNHC
jgi:hypothetical protein